jgi:hypothetical protein
MANANLDFSGLTVTQTFTFPDATGTIALTTGGTAIVTVGTITTGTWHATKIGLLYGGTNADLSGTGGTSNVLQQSTVGGTITVGQLAVADLSTAKTGSGSIVLATGPTVTLASASTAVTQTAADNSTKIATTAYADRFNVDPQFFVPTTGQTISPTATGAQIGCFVNPSGTLLALTLTLPTGTIKGQELYATFTQIITGLTVTATNLDTKGKVEPTAAAVGDTFGWRWDSVSTKWNRFV